jgi:hypothetical protein
MVKQIKDINVIKREESLINPIFFVPPDVIDVRPGVREQDYYEDPTAFDEFVIDDLNTINDAGNNNNIDDGLEDSEDFIQVPEYVRIVEQQIRFAPDGTAVVDVIIEIDEVASATEYDVRVTKA